MTTSTRTSGSFVRRALGSMLQAREKQARRYVNGYLLTLDDATLAAHGYDREVLLREGYNNASF